MKRFLIIAITAATGLLFLGVGAAEAELQTIYGPVYVTKAKKDGHHHGSRHGDVEKHGDRHGDGERHGDKDKHGHKIKKEKDSDFTFTAPVPGAGIIIVKNGGSAGNRGRVSSAKIELNDEKIADRRDFNKQVEVLRFHVDLRTDNELEVDIKSCRECELEITILGDKPVVLPPRVILPVRGSGLAPL